MKILIALTFALAFSVAQAQRYYETVRLAPTYYLVSANAIFIVSSPDSYAATRNQIETEFHNMCLNATAQEVSDAEVWRISQIAEHCHYPRYQNIDLFQATHQNIFIPADPTLPFLMVETYPEYVCYPQQTWSFSITWGISFGHHYGCREVISCPGRRPFVPVQVIGRYNGGHSEYHQGAPLTVVGRSQSVTPTHYIPRPAVSSSSRQPAAKRS